MCVVCTCTHKCSCLQSRVFFFTFLPLWVMVRKWNSLRATALVTEFSLPLQGFRENSRTVATECIGLDFWKRTKLNVEMMQSLARKCYLKARRLVHSPRETVWSEKRKETWVQGTWMFGLRGEISFWCCAYPSCSLDLSFILQKENHVQGSPGVLWEDVPSTR